jgi:hypothetical protein
MAEPADQTHDTTVPPEVQPASSSEEIAASVKQETAFTGSGTPWAEVLNAMRSAEEAVSRAVQGMAMPASSPEETAASVKQETASTGSATPWAEVSNAMRSAEEAVSMAVQGMAKDRP